MCLHCLGYQVCKAASFVGQSRFKEENKHGAWDCSYCSRWNVNRSLNIYKSIVIIRRFLPKLGVAHFLPLAGQRAVLRPCILDNLSFSDEQLENFRVVCCRLQGLQLVEKARPTTQTKRDVDFGIIRGVQLEAATVSRKKRREFYNGIKNRLVAKGIPLIDFAWLQDQMGFNPAALTAEPPLPLLEKYKRELSHWYV